MQSVGKFARRQALPPVIWLAVAAILLCAPAPAIAFDLFARHEVSVQFATPDGKPMANAEVKVYAPSEPQRAVVTGRTDKDGKFAFAADRDGLWTAEARDAAEVARATVRVGGPQEKESGGQPLPPYLMWATLGGVLAVAIVFRFLRNRARRR